MNSKAPELDVSILIVSYNTREMTLATIASVFEQAQGARFEVIVVDNASSDGSAEAIASRFPQVKLIASQENLGFGGGNNLAGEAARGRRILLLNPDTVVLDHAIDRLCAFADAHPNHGVWGGRTVFADGSLNPASCWGRPTLWSLVCLASGLRALKDSPIFNPEGYGGWRRDSTREVDIVAGCFLLIDADLWRRLGGFDLAFFMYAEEADLCLRAHKLGARPIIVPEATIIHHGHASEPKQTDMRIKLFAGRITLIKRHDGPLGAWMGTRLYVAAVLVRVLGLGLLGRLTGAKRLREAANAWQDLWARRELWIHGWNDAGVAWARTASRPAAATGG
ncbi:MAG: glycosyltransferase family 2 protein [Caulobacteraceae bacterium]|nr:glycosyltransferase family 2 protein [Caulobacteraceae bacterium]